MYHEVTCNFRFYLGIWRTRNAMFSNEHHVETKVVHAQEYPITLLPMSGLANCHHPMLVVHRDTILEMLR